MGIERHVIDDLNLAVFEQVGLIDDEELIAVYVTQLGASSGVWEMDWLIDLRRARSENRTAAAIEGLAEKLRFHGAPERGPRKIALIAHGALTFGLARMFEAHVDKKVAAVRVFRRSLASLAWLDVPPERAREILGEEIEGW